MSGETAASRLAAIIAACVSGRGVTVLGGARRDAKEQFRLRTSQSVIDFIANGGLEDAKFHSTQPFQLEGPDHGALVDSYEFFSGPNFGYMAFFRNADGIWVVKSFKKNDRRDPRFNLAIFDALKRAGKLIDGK